MQIRGVAHRGYPGKFPENTLSSFRAACELAFTHTELDVQLSKDGVPIVFHDTSVDRMTNGTGKVKDLKWEELKSLSVAGLERIPTLEETLRLLKDNIIVDIELKQMGELYPGLEAKVLDLVKALEMQEQVVLTSFDHYSLVRVRELDSDVELGVINHGASPALFSFCRDYKCNYLSIHYHYFTEALLEQCQQEQITLIPYTIDQESELLRMSRYPELLICTNELERWADVSRKYTS